MPQSVMNVNHQMLMQSSSAGHYWNYRKPSSPFHFTIFPSEPARVYVEMFSVCLCNNYYSKLSGETELVIMIAHCKSKNAEITTCLDKLNKEKMTDFLIAAEQP